MLVKTARAVSFPVESPQGATAWIMTDVGAEMQKVLDRIEEGLQIHPAEGGFSERFSKLAVDALKQTV